MALKALLEFAHQVHGLVGLEGPSISYQQIAKLLEKGEKAVAEFLRKANWFTQAVEIHGMQLDGALTHPLGVHYVGSKGGWKSVSDMDREISEALWKCAQCLKKGLEDGEEDSLNVYCAGVYCEACMERKAMCDNCAELGREEWNWMRRQCKGCKQEGLCCTKVIKIASSSLEPGICFKCSMS
jgi:hypothetical protein